MNVSGDCTNKYDYIFPAKDPPSRWKLLLIYKKKLNISYDGVTSQAAV